MGQFVKSSEVRLGYFRKTIDNFSHHTTQSTIYTFGFSFLVIFTSFHTLFHINIKEKVDVKVEVEIKLKLMYYYF